MEDFIKNIIIEKRYIELTQKEKSIIKKWVANEDEFDTLKSTLLYVSAFRQKKEAELSHSVKEKLNDRFAAKHSRQKEIGLNKFLIFLFPRDKVFFKKPVFQLAVVALVVALVIPFLWQNKVPQYAMNTNVDKLELDTVGFSKKEHELQLKLLVKQKHSNENGIKQEKNPNQIKESVTEVLPRIKPPVVVKEDPSVILYEESVPDEEIYLEEVVETKSLRRAADNIQQLDEIPLVSSDDVAAQYKKETIKPVDVSETLGLLTALY